MSLGLVRTGLVVVRLSQGHTNVVVCDAAVGKEQGFAEFVVSWFLLTDGFAETASDVVPRDFCVAALDLLLGSGDG